jgi:hypothetical protein
MVPSVIVIARPEQVGLWKRLSHEPGVALYSAADSLQALDAIIAAPPRILALDRMFVASVRGAALVARVKSDPHLQATDVRVLAEDESNLPVLLSVRVPGFESALVRSSYPLDYCGTRRAPRFTTNRGVQVSVNGSDGQLVDLSCIGAQVRAPLWLRPEEAIRVALIDGQGRIHLESVVAWCVAEPIAGAVTYRAGVEFVDFDSITLEVFCVRNIADPPRRTPLESASFSQIDATRIKL